MNTHPTLRLAFKGAVLTYRSGFVFCAGDGKDDSEEEMEGMDGEEGTMKQKKQSKLRRERMQTQRLRIVNALRQEVSLSRDICPA
jgi:hypothetical protein